MKSLIMVTLQLVTTILWAALVPLIAGSCEFDPEWIGSWFMSARGDQGPIVITKNRFGNAKCIEKGKMNRYFVKETYLSKNDDYTCYKCMVINMKHENVIQFKESYCEPESTNIDMMCQEITGDALLLSIFRLEAQPVSCPFHGPFTFTYSKGFDECKEPMSQVDSCADDSRLLFRHQACPDVLTSETYEEELVCLGSWKEGLSRYLVGKINHTHANMDEDRYRCFMFAHPTNQDEIKMRGITWNLAQSADATCQGLNSATEGAKTMKLTKNAPNKMKCKFPGWFTEHILWHTLDYSQSYFVYHRNSSLRITNGTSAPEDLETRSHTDVRLVCHSNVDKIRVKDHETRANHHDHHDHHAHKRQDHSTVTLIVHVTVGCRSGYKCMRIYKRDGHVVQTQSGELAYRHDEACSDHYWNPETIIPITLVARGVPARDCGPQGSYTISSPSGECGDAESYSQLVVGCTSHGTIKLHATCPTNTVRSYQCHGQWHNEGVTYVVASPSSRPSGAPRRVCFAYSGIENTISLTGQHDNCIARQHDAPLKFNATLTGQCVEASSQASGSPGTYCHSCRHSLLLVISCVIWYLFQEL